MDRGFFLRTALVVAAGWASGCGLFQLSSPRPPAAPAEETAILDAEPPGPFLAWASGEPLLVIVDKEARELSVYEHGRRIRAYPAVFGRKDGRKVFEGDRRTPSGLYRITRKRKHWRFHRFFDLDYPTSDDVRNFRDALAAGLVPASLPDGRRPGTGGSIGIHGTDDANLNRLQVDWTLGCVSLLNEHMDDLATVVPEGTPVLIRDGESPFPAVLAGQQAAAGAEMRGALATGTRKTLAEAPAASGAAEVPAKPRHARAEPSDTPVSR